MLACPTWFGGQDWETGAYSPRTNTMYMPLRNACARMTATRDGGMNLYALAARNEFAPGFDQLALYTTPPAPTRPCAYPKKTASSFRGAFTGCRKKCIMRPQ